MIERVGRRRYLVDWNLQGSLCVHGMLYGSLVLIVVSFGIFAPLLWDLGGVDPEAVLQDEAIVMLYLHEHFWPLALVCFLVVVLGAVLFSHRVAGPMVRYKRNLRQLANGKLAPPLHPRRSDYMTEEIGCLNDAISGVGERVGAIRNAQVEVRRRVTALLDQSTEQPSSEAVALVAACDQLEAAVREFRHVDPRAERASATETEPSPEVISQAGGV